METNGSNVLGTRGKVQKMRRSKRNVTLGIVGPASGCDLLVRTLLPER